MESTDVKKEPTQDESKTLKSDHSGIEIYDKVLSYLKSQPEIAPALLRAVEQEEMNKDRDYYLGWNWEDVRVNSSVLKKLFLAGIINLNYSSRKHRDYILSDREGTIEALRTFMAGLKIEVKHKYKIGGTPTNLFDNIVGYDDVKHILSAAIEAEKPTHFLLIGAVATAKSSFLDEIDRISGASLILGGTSTKVGIFDILFEEEPKFLLIDEIDKSDRANLSVLLSLCQSGHIKQVKHMEIREKYLSTKVVAACNSTKNLPPEILSRFGKIFFKPYSENEALEVMELTLVKREGVEPSLAAEIAKLTVNELKSKDVREAVRISRLVKNVEEAIQIVSLLNSRGHI